MNGRRERLNFTLAIKSLTTVCTSVTTELRSDTIVALSDADNAPVEVTAEVAEVMALFKLSYALRNSRALIMLPEKLLTSESRDWRSERIVEMSLSIVEASRRVSGAAKEVLMPKTATSVVANSIVSKSQL